MISYCYHWLRTSKQVSMATGNDESTFDSLIEENVVTTPGRKLSVHTEPSKMWLLFLIGS